MPGTPAPTLKLGDTSQVDRPKVEFLVKRMVYEENEDGELDSVNRTEIEVFQLKLQSELTLGDYEEIFRIQNNLLNGGEFSDETLDEDAVLNLMVNYRRLMDLAFYDDIPREAVYGLTLDRMREIADFLYELWPKESQQKAMETAKAKLNEVRNSRRLTGTPSSSGSKPSTTRRPRRSGEPASA